MKFKSTLHVMAGAVFIGSLALTAAHAAHHEKPKDPRSLGLSDEHILKIGRTIDAYVYMTGRTKQTLNLFDPIVSEPINLKHKKTQLSGDCLRNLGDGFLLACAEFEFIDLTLDEEEKEKQQKERQEKIDAGEPVEEIDRYIVGFLISDETKSKDINVGGAPIKTNFVGDMKVIKAGILEKNGQPIREWVKNADGAWETKLIVPAAQ